MSRLALYFGCRDFTGHELHRADGGSISIYKPLDCPWVGPYFDGGLLADLKVPDSVTGRVHWKYLNGWWAFVWWDRSGDSRPGSHSGFYADGFSPDYRMAAFLYACELFPDIAKRQKMPFQLVTGVL